MQQHGAVDEASTAAGARPPLIGSALPGPARPGTIAPMVLPRQTGTTPVSEPEGVHPIHVIPGGTACVRDQAERIMEPGQSFVDVLLAEYKDLDVVDALASANDLIPNDDGTVSVFVPPGVPIVIPEMCYPKEGAGSVSLQASGVPDDSNQATFAGLLIVVLAIAGLFYLFKRIF